MGSCAKQTAGWDGGLPVTKNVQVGEAEAELIASQNPRT